MAPKYLAFIPMKLDLDIILFLCIYILGVFTEKPYSKPLECNVIYIPITTSSHTMMTK